jgi:hypothetical protein
MKVWIHPEAGELMISWHVFACVRLDEKNPYTIGPGIEMNVYQYVGEACENSHGMTCVMPDTFLNNFEYLGEL